MNPIGWIGIQSKKYFSTTTSTISYKYCSINYCNHLQLLICKTWFAYKGGHCDLVISTMSVIGKYTQNPKIMGKSVSKMLQNHHLTLKVISNCNIWCKLGLPGTHISQISNKHDVYWHAFRAKKWRILKAPRVVKSIITKKPCIFPNMM